MKIRTKYPKIKQFKNDKDKKPYIIKKKCKADSFTASLSKLYNQMNKKNKILKEGDEFISKEVPWGYFKYKNVIWPVYADDAGQCDYIYVNGKSYSGGTYNFCPEMEFVYYIDKYYKGDKK